MKAHPRLAEPPSEADIGYGRHSIDESDIAAVTAVLRSQALTQGKTGEQFEKALAASLGTADVVAVSSGTAALHLCGLLCGFGPGDAVFVPALTFAATANVILHAGATPVFVDIDENWGMSASSLREAITLAKQAGLRPAGVLPVHFAGLPAAMGEILRIAGELSLVVVEDACHALGGKYRLSEADAWKNVGGLKETFTAFSFHPVKAITTGEGGAIATADPAFGRAARQLRAHGIEKDPSRFSSKCADSWYHEMQQLGFNYRLSDIQAALGLSQLRRLDSFIERRREIAEWYRARLEPLKKTVRMPPGDSALARHAYHLFVIRIDFARVGKSRDRVMKELASAGILTQVHYIPVPGHPFYAKHPGKWRAVGLPRTQEFYETALSLPIFPDLSHRALERIAAALEKVLG